MTPFKTKVTVAQYESMGYDLKVNDILYRKKKDGSFAQYVQLMGKDEANEIWLGKSTFSKPLPVSTVDSYIEMVVIPFDQYTNKMKQRGYTTNKK